MSGTALEQILRGPSGLGTAGLSLTPRQEPSAAPESATPAASAKSGVGDPIPGLYFHPVAEPDQARVDEVSRMDQAVDRGGGALPAGLRGGVRRLLGQPLHGRLPPRRAQRRPRHDRHPADGRRERRRRLLLRGPRRFADRPRQPACCSPTPRSTRCTPPPSTRAPGRSPWRRTRPGAPTARRWSTSTAAPPPPSRTGSGTTWRGCTSGTSPRVPGPRRSTSRRCGSTWRCVSSTTSAPARPSPTPSAATSCPPTCTPVRACSGSSRWPRTPPPS